MQELIDILVETSPYSQLAVAGGVVTAHIAADYAQDRLTEDKDESVNVRAERDYMLGYKDECPWESLYDEDSQDDEISDEEARSFMEE